MKYTINLKYDMGDEVRFIGPEYRYSYGYEIPEEENHWKVDGYAIKINDTGIHISYCFHAYCNKYFEYHELIDEKDLEPISENHPNTIEWEPKDVFGNIIELGDVVYSDLYRYHSFTNSIAPPSSLSFIKKGVVEEFIKSNNMYWMESEGVGFYSHTNYNDKHIDGVNNLIVKIPDSFVEDMAKFGLKGYLETPHYMEKFKEVTGWFGLTDECLARYEELKNKKEKKRDYNGERNTEKKTNTKKAKSFNAESILSGLSKKEKEELLKVLTK